MADAAYKTPVTGVDGNVYRQPDVGAYSAANVPLSKIVENKTPYALLDKTGQLPKDAPSAVFNQENRWLREIGITSASASEFEKTWDTEERRRKKTEYEWRDTYGGRLAIRSFSRGIMGSVFFTAGQHLGSKYLRDYSYDHTDLTKSSEITNPLQFAARVVDKTIGQGIYKAALLVNGGDKEGAKRVVTFRHTNHFKAYGKDKDGKEVMGRSYGHEGLAITFDFGLASLGDYFGREIAGLIDPNSEKKWMKDGRIDVPQATKALLGSIWTGVSKSMGEDYFAMAAGYQYVVRATRSGINKFSPGFKYDSDRWGNGGSFKVDDSGKIVGNYQLEGMLDLGVRFTAYNVMTKMFRDGYDKVANEAKHFWEGDRTIHYPHFDKPPTLTDMAKKTVDGVKSAVQYVARTVVKTSIIMIPSSSLFAFIRAAQSKDIGLAIHPEHGPVGVHTEGRWIPVYSNATTSSPDTKRSAVPLNKDTDFVYKSGKKSDFDAFAPQRGNGQEDSYRTYHRRFDPFAQNVTWHDKFTNPVGRFCYEGGRALTEVVKPVARLFGITDTSTLAKHVQKYVDATMAYTPYFMLKTDVLGKAYDTPRGDMAADRMNAGIAHADLGEIKQGGAEVMDVIMGRPFADPDREKAAQKKMLTFADQIWNSQEEIIAKEREEERQERVDAALTLGKPVSMQDLYGKSYTERVGRRGSEAANDGYYAQNITPMPLKKPEEYKKPETTEWKKQANGSWSERAMQEFRNNTNPQGQTIN